MADPRANVSFGELDYHGTTYKSTGLTASAAPTGAGALGGAVTLTSAQTVGKGSQGNRLVGSLRSFEADGFVTVQDQGFMQFYYSGTTPTVNASVEVDGNLGVQAATSNDVQRDNRVVDVDTTNKIVTIQIL